MKTRTLKQLLLYNYRYLLAYGVVFSFIGYFLGWRLSQVGPGLSPQELTTAARHVSLGDIGELPIYPLQAILQWASMELFGVSTLSLRLPSILISAVTIVLLFVLLRRLFGRATALLSVAIFVSADWLLFTARLGVGAIEFSFWLTLVFFALTKLIARRTHWLLLLAVALGGLTFAPFGIYAGFTVVVCLFSYTFFRQRLSGAATWVKIVSILIALLWCGLLIWLSIRNSELIKTLLGVQQALPSPWEYAKNVVVNSAGIIGVLPNHNPVIGPSGVFFVRFFELIFSLFGVVMLWKGRVNRLYVMLVIVTIVAALASGLSDGPRGGSLLLVPAMIYITAGVRHFVHRWQRTFPKNPYARITGFLPLAALFILVVGFHYQSYFVLWPNQTVTRRTFTHDYQLLQDELNNTNTKECLVIGASAPMEKLLKQYQPRCQTRFNSQLSAESGLNSSQRLITVPEINLLGITQPNMIRRALVSGSQESNVRWVVLEPASQN